MGDTSIGAKRRHINKKALITQSFLECWRSGRD
jgi:hypothetical protein